MDDGHGRGNFLSAFFDKLTKKNENISADDEIMDYLNNEEFSEIAPFQKEMIENILDFDDIMVKDIMTHRRDISGVEKTDSLKNAVKVIIDEGFSRIPVYDEEIDNICGMLFAKDLLKLLFDKNSEEYTISDFMREALFVPETNNCVELFELFTSKRAQIAVVLDEYGGTSGIVTMEDLLEQIVGSIQDEYDDEEAEIEQITPDMYDCLGSADPEDVSETVGFELPEGKEYDTMGGLFLDLLGRIPEDGESPTVHYDDYDLTALIVKDKRIERIRIHKKSED